MTKCWAAQDRGSLCVGDCGKRTRERSVWVGCKWVLNSHSALLLFLICVIDEEEREHILNNVDQLCRKQGIPFLSLEGLLLVNGFPLSFGWKTSYLIYSYYLREDHSHFWLWVWVIDSQQCQCLFPYTWGSTEPMGSCSSCDHVEPTFLFRTLYGQLWLHRVSVWWLLAPKSTTSLIEKEYWLV